MSNRTSVQLKAMKANGQRIVATTAYDSTMAALIDEYVDVILVGDSLGMVVQGHDSTLKVTLEQIAYHCAAVTRVARHAHVVADLPFMTYQVSPEQAMRSAATLLQDGSAQSVKLEGGSDVADSVSRLVRAGVPVMGHLGLTPQSVNTLGGYRVQGRGQAAAETLLNDARALEGAGAYAIVLEMVPIELAARVTDEVSIPTIGIGAGDGCDGQVLVSTDLLGLNPSFKPKFVKRYANLGSDVQQAMARYAEEVRSGAFPRKEHGFRSAALEIVAEVKAYDSPPAKAQ